jgi:hypothetical protein
MCMVFVIVDFCTKRMLFTILNMPVSYLFLIECIIPSRICKFVCSEPLITGTLQNETKIILFPKCEN